MNKFNLVRIGDIGNVITGKTPKTDNKNNYGEDYMFIGPTDLHKHLFIKNSEKMLSQQGLESIKGSILNGVSILVGCIGWDMGNVGIVEGKCATNQQINSITNIGKNYNPLYIYYWLKNKKDYLFQQASVTRTPILNKTNFSNVNINVPTDKDVQDRVSNLLVSIDAKIELNNRINTELEAMAKTLYDYWFVQFDFPDANSKPYKTSGGKMIYNPTLKREIPEGWTDDSLWNIATYFNGLPMQKHRPKGNDYIPVIKIREMGEGVTDKSEKASPEIPKKAIINDGDVLFSWSATLDVKVWSQGKGALNQHIFKVTSDKHPKSFYYYELINYLSHFKMMADKRKTTMGHITQDHLKQAFICLPPVSLMNRLHKIIKPIFNKHLFHEKENRELSSIRDWLLPMLMNGQITVK